MRRVATSLCAAASWSLVVCPVSAQQTPTASEASPTETALARELVQRGVDAIHARRWEEARDDFSRAYQIIPRPEILLNLATAQAQTGHLVEAAESYRAF